MIYNTQLNFLMLNGRINSTNGDIHNRHCNLIFLDEMDFIQLKNEKIEPKYFLNFDPVNRGCAQVYN
jgi:hypothetical protein